MKSLRSNLRRKPKGQVLVLVALMFIALVAIIGLAIDTGYVFVYYARLRRATDAASLSAAAQFREGWTATELNKAAVQFLTLNDVVDPSATVNTCSSDAALCPAGIPLDPSFCTNGMDDDGDGFVDDCGGAQVGLHPDNWFTSPCADWDATNPACPPGRKLVRVNASSVVPLNFMAAIGINQVTLSAEATAEAASVDVVLVIDTSESMTNNVKCNNGLDDDGDGVVDDCNDTQFGATPDNYYQDPSVCNVGDADGDGVPGSCDPFGKVKAAALAFAGRLYYPYDRLGIVTFDNRAIRQLELTTSITDINDAINGLTVYDATPRVIDPVDWGFTTGGAPGACPDPWPSPDSPLGPCRSYNGPGLTNYGGFTCPVYYLGNGSIQPPYNQTINPGDASTCPTTNTGDGLYTAQDMLSGGGRDTAVWVVILLSDGNANASGGSGDPGNAHPFGYCPPSTWVSPLCSAPDPTLAKNPLTRHSTSDLANYDSDDYAYDAVDELVSNNILIYSIGQGNLAKQVFCVGCDPLGETLLKYAAAKGQGLYFFSPNSGTELSSIFTKIANSIATRITK